MLRAIGSVVAAPPWLVIWPGDITACRFLSPQKGSRSHMAPFAARFLPCPTVQLLAGTHCIDGHVLMLKQMERSIGACILLSQLAPGLSDGNHRDECLALSP